MASRRITVRVDELLQGRLDAMARTTGKSESQIVREAIAAHCNQSMVGRETRCAGAAPRDLFPPTD